MIERVRAILTTPAMTMLVIKRTKPGTPPYWVLPGGHADEADRSLEDALLPCLRRHRCAPAIPVRIDGGNLSMETSTGHPLPVTAPYHI